MLSQKLPSLQQVSREHNWDEGNRCLLCGLRDWQVVEQCDGEPWTERGAEHLAREAENEQQP